MNVDWKKYKRFFTFGCSFTSYMWPTWADIISKEMPEAEFYNLGRSGAGNLLISLRIAEANSRFKFTDTDLVMVMFTTYCREDRWIETEGGWITRGNVYNNSFYSDEWVRKYADERGYMIRDAALIDMTTKYLESLPSTCFYMMAAPFITDAESRKYDSHAPLDIIAVYEDTFNKFKPSMQDLVVRPNWKELENDYPFNDGHPSPKRYYDYMEKLGFNLTDKSKNYASETSDLLKSITSRNIVPLYFPEQDKNVTRSMELLF